jgi:23S rRNA (cytidine1920-2'-O)/16S rRNA (cytidine1409-2'-O)-methyltransferase
VVAAGLAETRTKARALILSGRVLVDDTPVDKVGARVRDDAQLRLRGNAGSFVSRGGEKLEGALQDLEIDVRGLACVDVGASTGGFSDCLLSRGAASVVAVDVGRGLLHEKLRRDSRVRLLERVNARRLRADQLPGRIDLVVVDVSFISLRLVLGPVARAAPDASILALVKPQFEVGRERVGKRGVVRDEALRDEAVAGVVCAAEELGLRAAGRVDSRIAGPKGNREIFLWLHRDPAGRAAQR